MRYMIVEHFRNGAEPVYARYHAGGRLAPEGLLYIDSWVTADLTRCYQLMDCASPRLLQEWINAWSDLVDFEVHPVITSAEAMTRALGTPRRSP